MHLLKFGSYKMNTMNRINAMIDMNDINFQLRIKF
jgi:hypothetical protein